MGLMNEAQARQAIVDAGTVLYKQGYVVSNDGNISVRISPDTIVVTPTGVSKGDMNPDMMVVMDLDGNVISKGLRGPSSEVKMHLRVYRENPDAAVMLSNHGVLTWGVDLEQALARMEVVENYAKITLVVNQIGSERGLSQDQVDGLAGIRQNMGLSPIVMPKGNAEVINGTDVIPQGN